MGAALTLEAAGAGASMALAVLPDVATEPAPGVCLRLCLLGRMEAWGLASTSALPRSRKARALLGVLGLSAGMPVPRTRLGALLWSRSGLAQQRGSLRQALHELQVTLGEAAQVVLRSDRDSVLLRADEVWVDALEVGRSSPAQSGALQLFEKGGDLLADLEGVDPAFDLWLVEQRRRLRDQAAAAAGAMLAMATGPEARAVAARRLLALDPTDEAGWRVLRSMGAAGPGAQDTSEGRIGAAQPRELRGGDTRAGHARPTAASPDGAWSAAAASGGAWSAVGSSGDAWPAPAPSRDALSAPDHAGAAGDGPGAQPGSGSAALRLLPASMPQPRAEVPVRRGARLGVLPLRALGEGLAPHLPFGISEAITAALARFRWIFVADCASLPANRSGSPAEAPESAARAMGLDLLLGGTLQPGAAPGQIRLAFKLTDLRDEAGAVVWAQRFDRDGADLLALQDEVAAEVVARMDPEILLIEAGRAAARSVRGTEAASAYDLLLRAMPAMRSLERAEFLQAGRYLAEAERLDPDHAPTFAWHAYWHLFLVGQGWAAEEDSAMVEAERLAARAVALDPMDAQGLTILGHVRAFLHHRIDEALALHRRALSLNPNLAMAWVFLGAAESYAGAHESALRRLDRYAALAPCHPHAFFFDATRGIPLLMLGRHEEAVEVGRTSTALHPGLSFPYKTYLSALGHLGLLEEAAEIRGRLLAIEPDFTVAKALRRTPVRRPADRAHYARGLRRAGLT